MPPHKKLLEKRRALIIGGIGIGDVLVAQPLLRGLKEEGYKITYAFTTRKGQLPILGDKFITPTTVDEWIEVNDWKDVLELRKRKYDVLVQTWQGTKLTAALAAMSKAKEKIAYSDSYHWGIKYPYTKLINHEENESAVSTHMKSLKYITGHNMCPDDKLIRCLADRNRPARRKWAAVCIGKDSRGTLTHGNWIDTLYVLSEMGYGTCFVGQKTKESKNVITHYNAKIDTCVDFEDCGLEWTQTVISHCDLFIGTNGGLAHVARMMYDIPTVCFNGNKTAPAWMPWKAKNIRAQSISDITARQAIEAIHSAIDDEKKKKRGI